MEEFRFGTGRYVNTDENLRRVLNVITRGEMQYVMAAPNNRTKKSRASVFARRLSSRNRQVTNANVQAVIAALRRRQLNYIANNIEAAENNTQRRARASRQLALANLNAVGDIENYFTGLGMTNANKLRVFKAVYAPVHYPALYPYRTNRHRAIASNNYVPNARDMNWFNHANKAAWAQRVINNAHAKATTIKHALQTARGRRATSMSAGLRTVLPNNLRKELVNAAYPGSKIRR